MHLSKTTITNSARSAWEEFRILPHVAILLVAVSVSTAAPATIFEDPANARWVQYVHKVWQTKDGLPENAVNTIAQTPDGYLWVGTQDGLVRFDGARFTIFDKRNTPALKKDFITCLFVSRDSALWIGTNGGTVVVYRRGEFREIPHPKAQSGKPVTRFCDDQRNGVWIGTTTGLEHYSAGKAEAVPISGISYSPNIRSLAVDTSGVLWVGTAGWGLWRLNGHDVAHFGRKEGLPGESVPSLLIDKHGNVWVGTNDNGLGRVTGGTIKQLQIPTRSPQGSPTRLLMDNDGNVIVLSNGFWKITGERLEPTTVVDDNVAAVLTDLYWDHEGDVWVGTFGEGLHCFRRGPFQTLLFRPQLRNDIVFPITEDRNRNLWFGTTGGGLFRQRNGVIMHLGVRDGLPSNTVQSFFASPNGVMWVGNENGLSVVIGSTVRRMIQGSSVHAIAGDKKGTVWVGTTGGTIAFDENTLREKTIDERLARLPVRWIQPDHSGAIWFATYADGLRRFHDGTIDTVGMANGLSSNSVISMYEDETGSLWLGTLGDGLNRYRNGVITAYPSELGLPLDDVMMILDDHLGSLWMSTNKGIVRVARKELEDYADGTMKTVHSVRFGENDGMLTGECNGAVQPSGCRASDGTLWFPTLNGAVTVNPKSMPTLSVPTGVLVENVIVDNTPAPPSGNVEFPPGSRDLEFHFTAPAFANPEKISFRYRLAGYNDDWIDAGSRRTAFYTNLPPGEYTFLVEAGIGNEWSGRQTGWSFHLQPFFYQTSSFLAVCAVLAISTGFGSFRLYRRYRDRMLQATLLQSQLAEARLKLLKMQLHPHFLFNTLNAISGMIMTEPRKSVTMLAKLSDLLRYSLENEFVNTVTLDSELQFLKLYLGIEQVRFGKRLSLRFDIRNDARGAIVPSLILQPLVENAINHGIAKKIGKGSIAISAVRDNGDLRIEIVDDGQGMNGSDRDGLKKGVGLTNTRNRLRQMYGEASQLTLERRPQGGVRVRMVIPFTHRRIQTTLKEHS